MFSGLRLVRGYIRLERGIRNTCIEFSENWASLLKYLVLCKRLRKIGDNLFYEEKYTVALMAKIMFNYRRNWVYHSPGQYSELNDLLFM